MVFLSLDPVLYRAEVKEPSAVGFRIVSDTTSILQDDARTFGTIAVVGPVWEQARTCVI